MLQEMYSDIPSIFDVRFRWVSMTPFGSPVVPEVNMISARSSGSMSTCFRLGQTLNGGFQLLEGDFRDPQVHISFGSGPGRERQFRVCPGYHPCDVVVSAAKVQGDQYDSRSNTPEENEHPVGRVGAPQDDLVPLRQAPALEEGCNLA